MIKVVKLLLCVLCLLVSACASRINLSEEFDRNVKAYNRLLRWHEIESAGITYIAPELRDDFMKQAAALKKRGLSVTDYRIVTSRYLADKKTGDVVAEFDYYILPSNRIKSVSYHQEWTYIEDAKSWQLKNRLPEFE